MIHAISDLHLGDCGPRDNFHGRERAFLDFLDYVKDNQLYIFGDLFDWWQVNLSRSIMSYALVLNRIAEKKGHYIIGNHDCAFKHFIGNDLLPEIKVICSSEGPFEEVINGKKFAFLHGHEADPTCSADNPGIGELTAIMSGMIEDKNGPLYLGNAVEDKFIGSLEFPLNIWRNITHQNSRREELIDGVEKYRLSKNADIVISGHTHEAGHIGTHHYNTGCWCREHNTFVEISDLGEVRVMEWTDNGPVPFWNELC